VRGSPRPAARWAVALLALIATAGASRADHGRAEPRSRRAIAARMSGRMSGIDGPPARARAALESLGVEHAPDARLHLVFADADSADLAGQLRKVAARGERAVVLGSPGVLARGQIADAVAAGAADALRWDAARPEASAAEVLARLDAWHELAPILGARPASGARWDGAAARLADALAGDRRVLVLGADAHAPRLGPIELRDPPDASEAGASRREIVDGRSRRVGSELFGANRWDSHDLGALQRARDGTVVIRNVDRLSRTLQIAVTRALRAQRRRGSMAFREAGLFPLERSSNARVVATSALDLAAEVAAGRFAPGLYRELTAGDVVDLRMRPGHRSP
jgi:hypothetical protein